MRLVSLRLARLTGRRRGCLSCLRCPGSPVSDHREVSDRWRGQVQLASNRARNTLPIGRAHERANGHEYRVSHDLASDAPIDGERRILAAILDETLWFIKMTGEDAAVASQRRIHRFSETG